MLVNVQILCKVRTIFLGLRFKQIPATCAGYVNERSSVSFVKRAAATVTFVVGEEVWVKTIFCVPFQIILFHV